MIDFIKRLFRRLLSSLASSARCRLIYGLKYGKGCRIYDNCLVRFTDGGRLSLMSNVVIQRFCEITAGGGRILIGNNTFVGQGTVIVSKGEIHIGNDCLIAEHVTIRDQNHHITGAEKVKDSGFSVKAIEIGDDTWIGAKCCILAGVRIGRSCVIGAGSVVTHDLPDRAIAAGSPARVIRFKETQSK